MNYESTISGNPIRWDELWELTLDLWENQVEADGWSRLLSLTFETGDVDVKIVIFRTEPAFLINSY